MTGDVPEHWKGLKMLEDMRDAAMVVDFKSVASGGLRTRAYVMHPFDAREYAGLIFDVEPSPGVDREAWIEMVCGPGGGLNFKGSPVIQSEQLSPGEFYVAVSMNSIDPVKPLEVPL